MSEHFVTVATFHRSFEAQLAKNVLEEEGIASTMSGEVTADMLPFGQAGGSDQIVLQVRENDAQRAAGILAAVAAAKLDDHWEDEAESGTDVWICSICGEPISNRLSICYSCQTPREGIRTSVPRDQAAIQPGLLTLPGGEGVQKQLEVAPNPIPVVEGAVSEQDQLTAAGDDLAHRALLASMSGILLPFALYYLTKLFFFSGELSPKGMRYLYGAILLSGCYALVMIIACGGFALWF
jgi:hypothetical protein